jgi:nickel and cobalt resistance protein CnrR
VTLGSRWLLLLALVAFVSAICGVFIGRYVADRPRASETELHALLHRELELSPQQHVKIDEIEARFAVRRKALELEMRAANARLAEAIEAEHGYGPKVTSAIDQTHLVMGETQKETLEHLFAMRAVLNPEQAKMFDSTVVKALTADAR